MNRTLRIAGLALIIALAQGCGKSPAPSDQSSTPPTGSETDTPPAGDGAVSQTPATSAPDTTGVGDGESTSPPVIGYEILVAARKGEYNEVIAALARGESVDTLDPKMGVTPLMNAVQSKCITCMQALIDAGANVNIRNTASASALIWAAKIGTAEAVQLLLSYNANPRFATPSGFTAMSEAVGRPDSDTDKAMIIVLLQQALSVDP